jgi:hypothetical protein
MEEIIWEKRFNDLLELSSNKIAKLREEKSILEYQVMMLQKHNKRKRKKQTSSI